MFDEDDYYYCDEDGVEELGEDGVFGKREEYFDETFDGVVPSQTGDEAEGGGDVSEGFGFNFFSAFFDVVFELVDHGNDYSKFSISNFQFTIKYQFSMIQLEGCKGGGFE